MTTVEKLRQAVLRQLLDPRVDRLTFDELAERLGCTSKRDRERLQHAVESLIRADRIRKNSRGQLRALSDERLVPGIVRRTRRGDAFVMVKDPSGQWTQGDIYVSRRNLGDAQDGDEVLVRLLKRRRAGGQRCGRVEEIVERATSTFVGTYDVEHGEGVVYVDGTTFNEPIYVGDPGAKGAQPGDKVVIEMIRFPSAFQPGEAVITRVLGPRGTPGVDEQTVIHEFGLRDEFPEAVLREARKVARRYEQMPTDGRLDLTRETIVTIDPIDARDFDDAISLKRMRNRHWKLGVHIADVSEFVREGSALDREAQLRGNSVYLPGRVLPMLPEVLSNGLASLQQGKPRLAKTVFIEFDPDGVPLDVELHDSVICVTRRFAYEQVLPIIREPQRFAGEVPKRVRELLVRMHELAMILRRRRFEAGALELHLKEVKVELDADGRVVGAKPVEHDESHQIIEEFMLAANMAVASVLDDRGLDFLRRVHADPDERKLKDFAEFCEALGYRLKNYQSRYELQRLIDRVHGSPAEHAVNYALLRSMKAAEYSPEKLGHYALAVENYCHFTSPIRRYPDLTVHRLVGQLVAGRQRIRGPSYPDLVRLGQHCSHTERRADSAERELTKIKLLTYMENRVGEEMDAVITGVTRFGVFCMGVEIPVEGLVHVATFPRHDVYDYDPTTHSLTGRRSGVRYRLGDMVRVRIAGVDVDRRELDLTMVAKKQLPRRPAGGPETDESGRPRRRAGRRSATAGEQPGTADAGEATGRSASGRRGSKKKSRSRKAKRKVARRQNKRTAGKRAGKAAKRSAGKRTS
ncbi:MAG: ribonuclease R [Planctomycetota bacterium]|nr:MAG: ribonuclease R [Planctomycetota bacterium]